MKKLYTIFSRILSYLCWHSFSTCDALSILSQVLYYSISAILFHSAETHNPPHRLHPHTHKTSVRNQVSLKQNVKQSSVLAKGQQQYAPPLSLAAARR
jgi:hypothetical protein